MACRIAFLIHAYHSGTVSTHWHPTRVATNSSATRYVPFRISGIVYPGQFPLDNKAPRPTLLPRGVPNESLFIKHICIKAGWFEEG